MMQEPGVSWESAIGSSADLMTTPEATRAGFAEQATAKAKLARPYIERARALKAALKMISSVESLLELTEYRESIVAACGLSIKARGHLKADEETLIRQSLTLLYEQAAATCSEDATVTEIEQEFRRQVLYRYLLTAGDTLGGSMRNYIGAMGSAKLSTALLEALSAAGHHDVDVTRTGTSKVSRIAWDIRIIVFDRTPKLKCGDRTVICNNLDVCMLDTTRTADSSGGPISKEAEKSLLQEPGNYLACGELKGGIDPGGADEHWKTTLSALDRVNSDFAQCGAYTPKLFFVGGAIAAAMAQELYTRLVRGDYSFAANLTRPYQLQALARWLIAL